MEEKIKGKNEKSDVVLVGPVGDHYGMPSLAVSILKRSLTENGISCRALYANLIFHRILGLDLLQKIKIANINGLILERIFAPMAHGEPVGHDGGALKRYGFPEKIERFYETVAGREERISLETFLEVQARSRTVIEEIVEKILADGPSIVGFSSSFQATNAILAVVKALKAKRPDLLCIMGGNNCEGAMGEEIAASFPVIDFVFQGEGDIAFADFCKNFLERGVFPRQRVVKCEPVMDLDRVPEPDYSDFMAQCDLPPEHVILSFESSRGCWWGHKHHCKFCGESALEVSYRAKSAQRVVVELTRLAERYPSVENYFATDSIFPHGYFKTFLPLLKESGFEKSLMYETKANLSRSQVRSLREAGVTRILAGIESLSRSLLKMLNKGSTPLINLKLLRSARECDLAVAWLILVGIPGDRVEDYQEQMRIMPSIHHLIPPSIAPVRIQRFSPYFREGEQFGIQGITPFSAYDLAYPESVDLTRLACFFTADYPSESRDHPEAIAPFVESVKQWQQSWEGRKAPELSVTRLSADTWEVIDTRARASAPSRIIDRESYALLRRLRKGEPAEAWADDPLVESFLQRGYLVEVDRMLLSVVCDRAVGEENDLLEKESNHGE